MIDPKTVPFFKLNNGGTIPCVGMGTFGSDRVTPDEVAGVFDVTKNTLWRWDKIGYLKPVRCGRRLHYKRSDVTKLLDGNNSPAEREKSSSGHSIRPQSNSMRRGGAAL